MSLVLNNHIFEVENSLPFPFRTHWSFTDEKSVAGEEFYFENQSLITTYIILSRVKIKHSLPLRNKSQAETFCNKCELNCVLPTQTE